MTGEYRIAINSYLTHSKSIARAGVAHYLALLKAHKPLHLNADIAY